MMDDTHWPATSALIDEACGTEGQCPPGRRRPEGRQPESSFVGLYYRGAAPCTDLEREYLEVYHPINECIPHQCGNCPSAIWRRFKDLYTAEELKTSRTYNELLFLRGNRIRMA